MVGLSCVGCRLENMGPLYVQFIDTISGNDGALGVMRTVLFYNLPWSVGNFGHFITR